MISTLLSCCRLLIIPVVFCSLFLLLSSTRSYLLLFVIVPRPALLSFDSCRMFVPLVNANAVGFSLLLPVLTVYCRQSFSDTGHSYCLLLVSPARSCFLSLCCCCCPFLLLPFDAVGCSIIVLLFDAVGCSSLPVDVCCWLLLVIVCWCWSLLVFTVGYCWMLMSAFLLMFDDAFRSFVLLFDFVGYRWHCCLLTVSPVAFCCRELCISILFVVICSWRILLLSALHSCCCLLPFVSGAVCYCSSLVLAYCCSLLSERCVFVPVDVCCRLLLDAVCWYWSYLFPLATASHPLVPGDYRWLLLDIRAWLLILIMSFVRLCLCLFDAVGCRWNYWLFVDGYRFFLLPFVAVNFVFLFCCFVVICSWLMQFVVVCAAVDFGFLMLFSAVRFCWSLVPAYCCSLLSDVRSCCCLVQFISGIILCFQPWVPDSCRLLLPTIFLLLFVVFHSAFPLLVSNVRSWLFWIVFIIYYMFHMNMF